MNKQIIIDYEEYLELEKIKKYYDSIYDSIYDYVSTKELEALTERRKESMGSRGYNKYDYACYKLSEILRYMRGIKEDVKNETESKGE